ncbi:dihydrolipoamide acetyltransferase family protein [Exiguobacterium antarcticum]|uniref:Dihydrolipoamide acetyltransferase component of pyruvate dehydrogenase complex n=1 Tax=Exiguobacterium antarcticum TaxID=132920 RepID=A0ABT6R379_9BACL|nr:dihydrolipoamide acetyltransferase family protein [Exiguobacterium antarcticum]AFS69520.1 Pyruvate dehydrogenase E2 [Exiguobacterium antarcticum B7]MDI3235401.1 dihydrolipoamide acetyltransferase family protein [Exiguobacterium antarcticum]
MIEVTLHDVGEGMTEGEIANYLVQVGDRVTIDQPVVEVSTDKMVAELPAPVSGKVTDILIPVGQTVSVGTILLLIDEEETETAATVERTIKRVVEQPQQTTMTPTIAPAVRRVLATPYTRKIARDHGIDLELVPATDPSGRVTEDDVRRFLETGTRSAETQQPVVAQTTPSPSVETIPFRGIRKQIAKKMTQSLFTIPHVTHFEEVDMTRLLALREELKAAGQPISVNAFFIKALIVALQDFPVFNAKLDEANEQIVLERQYHIGVATETTDGLIVPVVRDADKLTMQQLHTRVAELSSRAKTGDLRAADLKPSTFTMSNVGPLGSTGATPIINYPETALIAFHKTKKRVCVDEQDQIVIRSMMNLSMSFDHRVADGATAVAFTNRFAGLIEHPTTLLMELI